MLRHLRRLDEEIILDKSIHDKIVNVQGQEIKIDNVYENGGFTHVTITTDRTTALTKVYLNVDGKPVELKNTDFVNSDKISNGKITNTRTLNFPQVGKSIKLVIKGMTYEKAYNKSIDIPVK